MGNDFNSLNCEAWASLGASFPIADDRGSRVWNDFGNGAIPRNTILDSEGVVHYNSIGYNESAITAILDELLMVVTTEQPLEVPLRSSLLSISPNPFNAETRIQFDLPVQSEVEVTIYDGQGRQVRQLLAGKLAGGSHSVTWNSRNDMGEELPSGVYIATLNYGSDQHSQKLLLLK